MNKSGMLHDLVDACALREPAAPAVVHDGHTTTYAELVTQSHLLTEDLREQGVGAEHVVALDLPVGPRMIAAMLAAGRLEAAFLPLDRRDPRARTEALLADAAPAAVVTADGYAAPGRPPRRIEDRLSPVDSPAAYLSYTSGSTGEPKGVVTEQGAIVNYVRAAIAEYGLTASDRQLQLSSIAFDIAMDEVFSTLGSGAALVLRDQDFLFEDAETFLGLTARHALSVLNLPSGLWNQLGHMLRQQPALRLPESLRLMVVGGEAASPEANAAWHAAATNPRFRIVNAYGPTEAAVSVTFGELTATGAVTIGRPIPHVRVEPVDEHLRPVPVGEVGELLITGLAPARGYLDRPEQTAARFGLINGTRYYRTGDLGRVGDDGLLEFHGRIDSQVKVRGGFRVEPGEVAGTLLSHSEVAAAEVVPVSAASGRVLAAIVVPAHTDAPPSALELRDHLAGRLPDYMVPASFTMVERIPLTPRGKVDTAALTALIDTRTPQPADPAGEVQEQTGDAAEPDAAAVERAARESWQLALGYEPEDPDADFFEDGGDSLAAVALLRLLRERLGYALPLRSLYRAPRFEDMVRELVELAGAQNEGAGR
ncbi:amino acid adenylation domain-containing protein [Streptomyces sp. Li-HN-5-11]|uniref:amino acid adenylation domain-containing protein n=1 Tax=Streptomyces sp. Li-HN-5-11 TaxID=3075432 RepID=UPI0028AB8FC2|nr:amino acid adenylation domain-containing protein [Streptomyces sp. Li-HN-5-11]WNM30392.1 amino acid adenylation domain-containing protein [Streptomyces sp. Li-HN-5-11]